MAVSVFRPRPGAAALLAIGVLAGGCSRPQALLARPLPVVVQPAGEPWGLEAELVVDEAIHLAVANSSPRPVRILWDDCVYIDGQQSAHRLLTASAWAHHDFGPQVPAALAPGSRLEETLLPLGSDRERLGPLVPRPPRLRTRLWVGVKRWLFFQWHARVPQPLPQTVSVFLVLEDPKGRKTLMAPYAIGAATVS